ncbi:hypothetical protein [Pandoraea sp. 64-18]|uniref:hypothetical protein n=1 Tax=Pandoraea sp. 64-18 TaxID=1895806 RepID=UPI000961F4EE|nr:hypothetical protein [Pandoraea sp. 64-18]OJY23574.1 MAG: hypothetical protein BGP02_04705 [Pandoraea sp. 64-18]
MNAIKTVTFDARPEPGTTEYGSWINSAQQEANFRFRAEGRDRFKWLCAFEQALHAAAPTPAAQSAGQEAAMNLACYLVDHCEGETVTEEGVQRWLAAMLASPLYAAPVNGGERDVVEVAVALEQQRTLAIIKAVRDQHFGTSNPDLPTQASAAFDLACEEIEHRLRTEQWTLGGVPAPLPDVDAPQVAKEPQPVPANAVWTRHSSGDCEWWDYGSWKARKHGAVWVLTYAGKEIARHEYLQAVMRRASEPTQAALSSPAKVTVDNPDELTPPEFLASHLIDAWVAAHGKKIPWDKAIKISAIVTKMPDEERDRLLALGAE